MQKASQYLLGEHDFSSFRGSGCQSKTAIREVKDIKVIKKDNIITIDIQANAFLLHMVRIIVGTLLMVAKRELDPEDVRTILNKKDRVIKSFKNLERWKLKSCGAYFAYVEHPFNKCSNIICKKLLSKSAILSLPENMFTPINNKVVKKHIRIAFANINSSEIKEMFERLKIFKP